ncbi:winged helix-turn-helix transcriptional regulator [Gordonibacter massiliensis (ex Traore et al. 2017)]|uniref:winged helix-turn-helix transcriptional regulator n=1 Tax=Gordonibacter massiliensis (ex Traore et al. 2017) TaxID=1841863 RepID=UPI001C8BBECB|nr:helix-turn-helix domain-containing protein [Gordonibacter massiliensis (ex Traore et al. 2017)]MBX9034040.1 helix-turn-helix transcriptional regulator [Gordonibacter massiliensis (ex Traore et al. 2017)]
MARKRKLEKDIRCPLEYGLDVFGGKWKSRIVCVLSDGPLRYSAVRCEMANVTDAALAGALKELAEQGLVQRIQYEEIPPRVEYRLTEKGRSLLPVLQHICQWSGSFFKEESSLELARCQRCDYRP